MTVRLRPALALLAIPILNLGLSDSFGQYTRETFYTTMIAYALGLAAALAPDLSLRLPGGGSGTILLGVIALILTAGALPVAEVYFPDVRWASDALAYVTTAGFPMTLLLVVLGWGELTSGVTTRRPWIVALMLVIVLALGFALRALVIQASPEPIIDVYNLLRDSADFILAGKNPYAHDYHSPYHTARAAHYGLYFPEHPLRVPGYPPLPYLLAAIPRLFGADVRWPHAALDIIAGLALFIVGQRRGRPFAGLIAAHMYFHLPRTPFMIEQTWTEPIINGFLGLGFILTELSGWPRRVGHVCFGLALTMKQYGPTMLLPYAWAYRRQWRLVLLGLAVGVAIILPWFLWSPADFIDVVIVKHLTKDPGFHSVTIISYCADVSGHYPHPALLWLICGPLLLLISWRTPPAGPAAALAVGTALMTYVVFSPVGFINYFLPVQYLWLMGSPALMFSANARASAEA